MKTKFHNAFHYIHTNKSVIVDEYALARTERKKGEGYTGFECYSEPDVTIEQDLLRRDLTVNAMAMSSNNEIIDPYDGLRDLENRILRHVSPAFNEDPLRVLRVARFAARYHQYGFTVAPETLSLMTEISRSGELETLSAERIWKEMEKALTDPNPEVFFLILKQCQAIQAIWPELAEHMNNTRCSLDSVAPNVLEQGVNTLPILQSAVALSNEVAIRFSALCLEPIPNEAEVAQNNKMYTSTVINEQIAKRLKIPNSVAKLAIKTSQLHHNVLNAPLLEPEAILNLLEQCEYLRNSSFLTDILTTCDAAAKCNVVAKIDQTQSGIEFKNYLLNIAGELREITAKPFIEKGLQGKAIKEAMDEAKIARIAALKS
ncbi:MAG: multifunctional CCA tRNA nucleotidyl transferase/2'3'-cyclic phosphodiesterase/2'nucleotidase/phosphatase [Thalassotalea sp.]|nr:multifunctional CCA tRNA nucleotidyl transferase/2'3'-cyclic phosphodiesterase/2'nucleotidase/phosphatase [Thalassotalea sp.]